MRRFLTALLLCAAAVTLTAAEPAEKQYSAAELEAAETLLKLDGTELILNQVIQSTIDAYIRQSPDLEPYREIVRRFIEKSFGFPALRDDLVRLTLEHYTPAEIDGLIAFYRTPLGEKKAKTDPQISVGVTRLTERQLNKNLPAFYEELAKALETEQKK